MKTLKEYITEGLLDRVKNKEVNHEVIVRDFLEANYKFDGSYDIKETKSGFVVDVNCGVEVINKNIISLTNGLFEFGKVKRNFNCSNCKSLTSLEGAPKEIGGGFYCYGCNSLKTLEGAPEKVGVGFNCSHCISLKSLEGAPKEVGGCFNCSHCKSLTSLEGAPKEIGDTFDCSHCISLKSLEGAPKEVNWIFDCSYCSSLKSLKGAPEKVGETFRSCENKFSIEDIEKVVKAKRISISHFKAI